MSVPLLLKVKPNNSIQAKPYIKSCPELGQKWADVFASEKRPLIGINWQGNPAQGKDHTRGRSIPLESFAPIAKLANATLVSLQKGFGSEQRTICSFKENYANYQEIVDQAWDFLDTAAISANCDLVITSDTAIAHLAGGMGKKPSYC